MKKIFLYAGLFGVLCLTNNAWSQERHIKIKTGEMIIPDVDEAKMDGPNVHHMRPDIIFYKPNKMRANGLPGGETPASISCIYGFTRYVPGCPIEGTTEVPTGGWGAIALIEARHDPNAENDLNVFSRAFGLPPCTTANGCFQVVFANGVQPPLATTGEHALDIEWAHAMAPHAKIIMVEGDTFDFPQVISSLEVASRLVQAAGGGQVSMSSSTPEFAGENAFDGYFQRPGIVYFGSAGDFSAPARYPSSSPFVISSGGTSIIRDNNGNFVKELAWSTNPAIPFGQKNGGSGGPSLFEPRPYYQNFVAKVVGGARGTPDMSFDSNPATGVDVFSTLKGGWVITGGTSAAAPALAGIVNSANSRATSTTQELSIIYNGAVQNYHSYWHDVLEGYNGFNCLAGYDFVTGLGSPFGYKGK